jgi:hypothetical protein
VYFNSWQLVDGLTSVMKHGHHSWAYSESLTKIWGSSVYSSPPYSTYCTLKIHMLDPKPLLHPRQEAWQQNTQGCYGGLGEYRCRKIVMEWLQFVTPFECFLELWVKVDMCALEAASYSFAVALNHM